MTAAILALLTPFVLVGMLIVLDKLCGVIAAEVRRARMRARTRRSLRERAMENRSYRPESGRLKQRRDKYGIF